METVRQGQTHLFFNSQVRTDLTDLRRQELENLLSKRHRNGSCEKTDYFFPLCNSSELFQISSALKKNKIKTTYYNDLPLR